MEIIPIRIEHAAQFGSVLESIALEADFPIQMGSESNRNVLGFVERQLLDDAPMFVAFEGGLLVGWCEISLSELDFCKHSGLLSMGVLNGYRGCGVGSWLINKCISAGRTIGFERIELTVLESNAFAQAFYRHKGFEVEGKKTRSLKMGGQYFSEILMAKQISQSRTESRYCV